MAKVAIVMGSTSDREVMTEAEKFLTFFGIDFETLVLSAHRTPEETAAFSRSAREKGFSAIIAGAGMAAHLPGVIASFTTLPVIGVPLEGSALNGVDALYSIVQMPKGIPVACMAIGKAGAGNAAILAAEIVALQDERVRKRLADFRRQGSKL
ncbi:MAG TPA: 5-(carboxyamino)imidazole ribonucleotide mutase [bacterium]|jgi:5-(carboxyamino)imidazole ribonucleotide mutase|nr:5-(carboxyamino)imidazole ribonucleotide mutase [bacterium]HNT66172.1 5-(carboxyamino)imidazole ribonucleotide mutase [bacterium]HOX86263.1 5-(carboxyamino)imidazole ribonucleotide mutase [bacterium]HPG45523.1 5-(carboxyamino)imidazole ribonucleotide mutase [bacterium]HPM97698.1 5-(carboxyamino)imidazole ribonucleotide mutase [bacterium]